MDDLLRCPICFDFYNTAMILPACSHNYCSLCINRYWSFSAKAKLECPSCRNPSEFSDLRPNRILDQIVSTYKANPNSNTSSSLTLASTQIPIELPKITPLPLPLPSLKRKQDDDPEQEEDVPTPKLIKRPENVGASMSNSIVIDEDEPINTTPITNTSLPTTPNAKIQTPHANSNGSSSKTKTQCPICFTMVNSSAIEYHVEKCINNGGSASKPKENPFFMKHNEHLELMYGSPKKRTAVRKINGTEYKPMGKLCYTIMNDKDIRTYLKKVQLPTTGDRSLLIKRHKEFVLRWNAECDKLSPEKQQDEIVKEVLALEKYGGFDAEKQVNSIKATDKQFEELTSQVRKRKSRDSSQSLSTSTTSTSETDITDTSNSMPNSPVTLEKQDHEQNHQQDHHIEEKTTEIFHPYETVLLSSLRSTRSTFEIPMAETTTSTTTMVSDLP
eukprot:TRINITY_DN8776_c0_g1_i2.p1 TRINITY_DN8776_c0_g1~~TRINITY_DN8776_c0_g1_i2.p1  ORF type:complete len:444 (-),score=100.46 TRINITY_DN8776_c0_g1_i2:977-2308(-)